jgi:DNA-binding NtrC family response regulator
MSPIDDVDVFDTQSPVMRQVLAEAARAAPLELPVLITGEAGVGKEWLARWIHTHSRRADAPFVWADCSVFQDVPVGDVAEHLHGPVNGGLRHVFDAAAGGTLFLHDVADLSKAGQLELVRILEPPPQDERDARRVDVRLIVATTRNLKDEVAQRRFRADLFYGLSSGALHIPPLRERPCDLWNLTCALRDRAVAGRCRPIGGFSDHAVVHLLTYPWPGNVRELEKAIEESCARATGANIELEDLPEALRHGCGSLPSHGTGPSRSSRPFNGLWHARLEADGRPPLDSHEKRPTSTSPEDPITSAGRLAQAHRMRPDTRVTAATSGRAWASTAIGMDDPSGTGRRVSAPPSASAADSFHDIRRLDDAAERLIDAALERQSGNRRRAAKELGISVATLQRKLRRRRRTTPPGQRGV